MLPALGLAAALQVLLKMVYVPALLDIVVWIALILVSPMFFQTPLQRLQSHFLPLLEIDSDRVFPM